ncbi:MAG: hypothetical protein MUO26_12530 [Methanotrichaceae archaeon]|nr:hypothetical protein [Methanotrichaceae archaeon]
MLSPLIPDTKHPKWIIVAKILEIIGSPRARKIAGRLKIYDVNNFLLSIKVLFLSDLFERDISRLKKRPYHIGKFWRGMSILVGFSLQAHQKQT